MGLYSSLTVGALVAAFAAMIFHMMMILDYGKHMYNHYPGECIRVKGIVHGSEDISIIEDEGLAFISSGVYFPQRTADIQGNIFLLNIKKRETVAKVVEIVGLPERSNFRPHGLSHWKLKNGKNRLFVISHTYPENKHSVELFDYEPEKNKLKYVKSVQDDKFKSINDLVAVGEDSFIVTNYGNAHYRLTAAAELFLGLAWGSVVYFDGKSTHYVLEKAISPNGIAVDSAFKHLVVANTNEETLTVYKLAKDKKSAKELVKVPIFTHADNLYLDPNGSIWTGAHPILKDLLSHIERSEDFSVQSPSQVLKIDFSDDWLRWNVTEVLVDDGKRITGSSVAIPFEGKLLVGSVARQLLMCDLK